jgi:hypothetical protein
MPQPKQYADTAARMAAYRERKRIAKIEAERVEREAQQKVWIEHTALHEAARQTIKRIVRSGLKQYQWATELEQAATERLGRPLTETDRATLAAEAENIQRSIRG